MVVAAPATPNSQGSHASLLVSLELFFKKMGLNIYFAGSISGGREDAAIYKEIDEKLKQYGTVLSPFVADPSLSLDQTGLDNCS